MKTLEQRILDLENLFYWAEGIQGTVISRICPKDKPQEWSVGFGAMHQTKHFFTAPTIAEAITKAENEFAKILNK
jgi:hypothetical protein